MGVDSACYPSEVGGMSTSLLVEGHSISGTAVLQETVGVVTCPRLCQIAKEKLLLQFQCSAQELGSKNKASHISCDLLCRKWFKKAETESSLGLTDPP